jgi:GNAT superfamily N-acetyltransferase
MPATKPLMRGILTGEFAATVARAEGENFTAFWARYGRAPSRELHEEPGLTWFATGIPYPLMNGVLDFRVAARAADARIGAVIDWFRGRGLPFQWPVMPLHRPRDLGERLEAHGLIRAFDLPAMSIDLVEAPDPPVPPGLMIRRVLDRKQLEAWTRVGLAAFEAPEHLLPDFVDLEMSLGLDWNLPRRRYFGLLDGRPVASSMVFYHAGVAGIYFVGTANEVRRRGVGAAVTAAGLRDARGMGYRWGVLQASPMGEAVYRRMGFREHARYPLFLTPE